MARFSLYNGVGRPAGLLDRIHFLVIHPGWGLGPDPVFYPSALGVALAGPLSSPAMRFCLPFLLWCFLSVWSPALGQDPTTAFVQDFAEEHSFLFLLDNRPNDLEEIRGGITKYIWKFHPGDRLKITQLRIDGDLAQVPVIHVTGFASKDKAMAFFKGLKSNLPDFLQLGMTKAYFPVSKSNFEQIVRQGSTAGYEAFFRKHYLP